jgi:hypothetical protein
MTSERSDSGQVPGRAIEGPVPPSGRDTRYIVTRRAPRRCCHHRSRLSAVERCGGQPSKPRGIDLGTRRSFGFTRSAPAADTQPKPGSHVRHAAVSPGATQRDLMDHDDRAANDPAAPSVGEDAEPRSTRRARRWANPTLRATRFLRPLPLPRGKQPQSKVPHARTSEYDVLPDLTTSSDPADVAIRGTCPCRLTRSPEDPEGSSDSRDRQRVQPDIGRPFRTSLPSAQARDEPPGRARYADEPKSASNNVLSRVTKGPSMQHAIAADRKDASRQPRPAVCYDRRLPTTSPKRRRSVSWDTS